MKQGRYQYLDKIGEGGMATVYRGVQRSLNRPVAIKVLSAQLSDNPSVRKRFKRESLIIARLNHPNIIHVIDKGTTSSGRPVFVMEYVEGKTLDELIRTEDVSFNRKIDILIQVCKGLAYAHKLDVVHRDIKPANILIDEEGNARLLDFGIASFFKNENNAGQDETRLIMGTEAYMAPEQHQGIAKTTARSDIYSLGIVMHEVLTGHLPAPQTLPSQYEPKLKGELETLLLRCIEHDPEQRPGSVEDVKNAMLKAMKGQHIGQAQQERAGEGLSAIQKKFALLDVLKEDRLGAVYLYEEKTSGKLLVIKKRASSLAGFKEASLLNKLKHPNIINIYGTSKNKNVFIVVMEYVAGGSLEDRLIKAMPLNTFIGIATQLCEGLAFAHRNNIYHGNLRPSNVLYSANGKIKLADFGMDEHYRFTEDHPNPYGRREGLIDELTDIYSLGAIFYHMLIGQPPEFRDGVLVQSAAFRELEEDLQTLICRMLDWDKRRRPQRIEAVLSELHPFIQQQKTVITESVDESPLAHQAEVIVKQVKSINWLSISLAIVLLLSLFLNVALLSSQGDEVRQAVHSFLVHYLL